MKTKILDILCCPECRSNLRLNTIISDDAEVIEGKLICGCGKTYPVLKGIPIMLEGNEQVSRIKDSFENEWMYFRDSDRTWGLTVEERKKQFLKDIDTNEKDLVGKNVLDAGCGNGRLTVGLSEMGLEAVGIDLTSGFENAYNLQKGEMIQFVQGDILTLPFKNEAFDFVFSSGVIHHTPDPFLAFRHLSDVTKNNGKLYIFVYKYPESFLQKVKDYSVLGLSTSISSLPIGIQNIVFSSFTAFFQFLQYILHLLALNSPSSSKWNKTWSERMVWFCDSLSPIYQSRHKPAEIIAWFKNCGFKNIKKTQESHVGYGFCGIKIPSTNRIQ
jgi:SAM-dependent methyltransferase